MKILKKFLWKIYEINKIDQPLARLRKKGEDANYWNQKWKWDRTAKSTEIKILQHIFLLSCMKRVASPGSMQDTGCLGLVHWDDPEGWSGEGGGFRMGNTCIPVADSLWYLA